MFRSHDGRQGVLHLGFSLLLAGGALPALAAGDTQNSSTATAAEVLEPVVVTGTAESAVPLNEGQGYELDRSHLDAYGATGGDATRVLELLPDIQLGEDRLATDRLYDLRPESMSIAGGKTWENNFNLDGLSIDNRLDPSQRSQTLSEDVAGHEQGLFIDPELIDSITVHSSNVPARYGRFNGGVVDMTTRRAGKKPVTRFNWRTTDSDWVDYHIIQPVNDDDPLPDTVEAPRFSRTALLALHSRPLGDDGVVAFVSANESETPTLSLGRTEQVTQTSHTASVRYSGQPAGDTHYDLALKATPYQSDLLIEDARNSRYQANGGGVALTAELGHHFADGDEGSVNLGISRTDNSRQAPSGFYNWAITRSRPWGIDGESEYSREGGFGDLDKTQTGINLRAEMNTAEWHWQTMPVRFNYGTDLIHSTLGFERPHTQYNYQWAVVNPDIQCRGYRQDCVDNEQFFSARSVYQADDVTVDLLEWGNFAEATVDVNTRLQTRLGLRHDFNSYTHQHDLAWRSMAELDLFGTQQTYLSAGSNRYYGSALLTYKLREARKPYYSEYRTSFQNIVTDWTLDADAGNLRYAGSDLDTPYSDEWTTALKQRLLGGVAALRYLQRDNKDQISTSQSDVGADGFRVATFNNEGTSAYRSVSLSWDRRWQVGNAGFNITWSQSEVSNEDYTDSLDAAYTSEYVWYRGEPVHQGKLDILRQNYGRPLMANVYVSVEPFRGFVASLTSQWRDQYDNIIDTKANAQMVDGSGNVYELPIYADAELHATLLTDLRLQWDLDVWRQHKLGLFLDINNITNARTYTLDPGESGVEVGRNLWLGMSYEL